MFKSSKKSIPDVAETNGSTFCLQTDTAGIILSVSPPVLTFTGKSENEILGNSFRKIVDENDAQKILNLLKKNTLIPGTELSLSVIGKKGLQEIVFVVEHNKNRKKTNPVYTWNAKIPGEETPVEEIPGERTENWFDTFLHTSADLLFTADKNGIIKQVNKPMLAIAGYTYKELINTSFAQIVHPADQQFTAEEITVLYTGNTGRRFENRILCKNGEVRWLNWSATLLGNKLFLAIGHDITNSKKAGEELKKKTDELNMVVSSIDDIVFEFDTGFRYKKVWYRDEGILEMMPRQFLGKTPAEAFANTPAFAQPFMDDFNAARQKKEIQSRHFSLETGETVRWFNSKITPLFNPDGSPGGYTQNITDISERKKVELAVEQKNAELKAAHRELNEIIENASEIIFKLDYNGNFLFVSPEFERALGYSAHEVTGSYLGHIIHPDDIESCNSCLQAIRTREKNRAQGIFRVRTKKQQYRWFNITATFSFSEEGEPQYGIGMAQDISELKQAIHTLEAAEESSRYQASILANLYDAVTSSDADLNIRSWNQAAEKLYGLKAEEVIGHKLRDFITLDYHNTTREELLKELYTNGSWSGEASFTRPKDKKKITFLSTLSFIKDASGKITDVIAINKDVTEGKLAEQSVRESEERFRQFASNAPVLIWVSDEKDNTIYVNRCWEEFTGHTAEDITTRGWATLVHPDDVQVAIEDYRVYFKQHKPVKMEYRLKNKSGIYRWVVDHGVPRFLEDGTFMGYIGSVIDIHDRKLAEEKVRFQLQVMNDVSDGIISTDLDFNVISFNRAAEQMYGIAAEDIVGKSIRQQIVHHYISETREEVMERLYETDNWEGQFYYDRKDGKRIFMHCSLSFVKDESGKRIGFAGIHKNITESRQAEEALRISEERYRSVVHALGEGILMLDNNNVIIACNKSAEEIIGVNSKKLVGINTQAASSFCIHEDGTLFPPPQFPTAITLETGKSFQNVIMGVQRKDASLIWISINTEPIYYATQRIKPDAVVASFVDITQKKAAEIELQRSQDQLKEYSERITNILSSITDGFIAVDKNLHILLWNHAVEAITGLKAEEVIGSDIEKVFPEFIGSAEYEQYKKAIDENITISLQHYLKRYNCWLETSVYPFEQGVFIYFRNISIRKKQELLLELEKEVLKINAGPAVPLKTIIDLFLEGMEKIYPDMLCSVLTHDLAKNTIHHLSAPSLPIEFSQSIEGASVGPATGSCGAAMYRKEPVITSDIKTDPLWKDFRAVAETHNVQSCWSFPILNAQNEVLATVATYYREPRIPQPAELDLLDRVSNLLRIIIENKSAETKIRLSNERYLLVTKATNDAIWDWDVATNILYWGEGFYNLFGHKPGYVDNSFGFWESHIHNEDQKRVIDGLRKFINDNNSQIWEDEYRFKKSNGEYALVFDRGFLIFDHSGKINRMVGSMQDITEKKEMEKQLLKQELDKQKLVAQAVVDAQEKERAEIGKELHDNVNQILSTAKLYLDLAKTEEEERVDLISRSTENISDAINEIRAISRSLVPPSVGDLGLVESIKDLVENIKATRQLHVEFYHEGEIDSCIDEKKKLMLFRIIQEQVNNVLRHAKATTLVIELMMEGHAIDLNISDDGIGFDREKVSIKKGVGLSNIASRAELFNGRMTIKTSPGNGCKLNINIPF